VSWISVVRYWSRKMEPASPVALCPSLFPWRGVTSWFASLTEPAARSRLSLSPDTAAVARGLSNAGMVRPETRKARPQAETGLSAEVEADALTAGVSPRGTRTSAAPRDASCAAGGCPAAVQATCRW
jgi:hypothetical protein